MYSTDRVYNTPKSISVSICTPDCTVEGAESTREVALHMADMVGGVHRAVVDTPVVDIPVVDIPVVDIPVVDMQGVAVWDG